MAKSKPRRIVYTRHPICIHNISLENALAKGISNKLSPLVVPLGELQRDITAEYLRKHFGTFDAVFCSEYVRTHEIPIACGHREKIVVSTHLNERSMGVWHEFVRAEVLRLHPGEDARYRASDYYEYLAPGGETCTHVRVRLRKFIDTELPGSGETVYLSGHGMSGICIKPELTGTQSSLDDIERLANASVSVFELDGDRYHCTQWNVVPWHGKIDAKLLKAGTEA